MKRKERRNKRFWSKERESKWMIENDKEEKEKGGGKEVIGGVLF